MMLWQTGLQWDRQVGLVFSVLIDCHRAREADRPVKGSFTVHPSLLPEWCLWDRPEGVCDFHFSLAFEFITVLAMERGAGQCRFIRSYFRRLLLKNFQHHYVMRKRVTEYTLWCFSCRKDCNFFFFHTEVVYNHEQSCNDKMSTGQWKVILSFYKLNWNECGSGVFCKIWPQIVEIFKVGKTFQ